MICEGRGSTMSLTPKPRHSTSHATKKPMMSAAEAICRRNWEFMARTPWPTDHLPEALGQHGEIRVIGHLHRPRPRKRHDAVVDDAARPCRHDADARGEERGLL